MVTSPINPLVIATASDDTTIRIWSLDPDHKDMPCRCILGGEGHQWSLLTLVRAAKSCLDVGRHTDKHGVGVP